MPLKTLTISELRQQLDFKKSKLDTHATTQTSSSFAALDALFPLHGLTLGSVVELLGPDDGNGAYALALTMARTAIQRSGTWAVVDTNGDFYPPAAIRLGLNLERAIIARPAPDVGVWTFTQLLRSPEVSASFWATRSMDNLAFRRFQLAAVHGGGLGFVMRPLEARRKPCWAAQRLLVERCSHAPERVRVTLLHPQDSSHAPSVEVTL